MRQFIFLPLFLFISLFSAGQQNEQVKKLVGEGIELHDKGDYEGAIKKYDEALAIDPKNLNANYEKAYSCNLAKRYKDCIDICKFIIKNLPDNSIMNQVYEVYGNAVDDSGDSKEALRIYEEGIKKFPEYYMLHFNEGVTYYKLNKTTDAINAFHFSLKYNALHPSSNYYLAQLIQKENRVPSMLAYMTFIAIEPQSDRSKKAFDAINEIIYRNIKKDGNNTTVSISTEMLDRAKDKSAENNFGSVEFAFSLLGTLDNSKDADSLAKTAAEKFDLKLQLLINSLSTNRKDGKGFYWEHFVPFFIEMKEKGHTQTLSHLVYQVVDEKSGKWLDENETRIKDFYDWMEKYKWN